MSQKVQVIAVTLLLFISAGFAQNYGKISGKVIDGETRDPLVGANVVLEGLLLGAATDISGNYVILQVPPGTYTVRVEYIGYKSSVYENVNVRTNRITTLNATLQPATLTGEEVVITADRPLVEKDNSATLRTVNSQDIERIPAIKVNEVLRTQPGVTGSDNLHFRGGRSGEVTYMVDGIPMVNPLFSEISTSEVLNQNMISEMQVISGTYSAEYGNAMSAIINITSKEGRENFQSKLHVKSSSYGLNPQSVNYNRNIVVADLSGPLLSRKTTFFVTGSLDDRDSYYPWGFRNEKNIFAKVTDRHIKNVKFTGSTNLSEGNRKNYSHSYKYIPEQYWYEPRTSSQMFQGGLTHTLRNNLYYNLNIYYNSYHYDSGDFDYNYLSPSYRLDANNEFYLMSFVSSFEEDDQKTYGIKGDLLWQANIHNEIKGGFEFRQHSIDRFYISSPYYDDHILDDYTREPREFAAYIQDKINFSSIILSAGLRFDLTDPNASYWPNPFDAVYNRMEEFKEADIHYQLSPRLGLSFPISEKTVLHFGYGHYFQRPEYQFIYKAMTDENYQQNIIMNLRTGNGRFGNPDLKPERTIQYEFGVSHQLFDEYLLNLSAYSKSQRHFTGARTFYAGDKPEYWETFTLHINEDFGYDNGLEFQLRKMRGRYLYGEINYTWALAEASSSGPLERVGIEEANRQSLKFFPTDWDVRHKVNVNLNLRFLKGDGPTLFGNHIFQHFKLSALFQYNSGYPYTKARRGATEPYEINDGRIPENWTIDLKINREIDMGFLTLNPFVEIYNLTNRKNVEYVYSDTGLPDYFYGAKTYEYAADPRNWGPPRLVYFGLDVRY
ncbi:MAG: TonB-dependent receptor [Calditrichaeota bacterium]|nr:MAG: TonB-dependent receptor [Calditrichota bacterium]